MKTDKRCIQLIVSYETGGGMGEDDAIQSGLENSINNLHEIAERLGIEGATQFNVEDMYDCEIVKKNNKLICICEKPEPIEL